MATLNQMIDEVRASLAGYTLRQDRITYLKTPISDTSLAIEIGASNNLAKGIIEIDSELIWIDNFNKATSTLNAAPGFGRGYQGTTKTAHSQYAQVTLAPSFPRSTIKQAINDTINSFFPKLWAIGTTTFTFNASQTTYPLPNDVESVIYASWQTTGASLEWLPINRWRADGMANLSAFGTTNTINIYENIQPGRTIQLYYTKKPQILENENDDFSMTGLPDSARDVVTLGASYKLLSYIDPGRITLTSAESDNADTKIPSTAGTAASRYIYLVYQNRLQEESLKLQDRYPIRVHYTK